MAHSDEWRTVLEPKLDELLKTVKIGTHRTLQVRFNAAKSGFQRARLPIPLEGSANDPNLKRLLLDGLAGNILGHFDPADTQIVALDWR